MPKSAASCFAVLACLLCFSAAPVAGQGTGQTKPAASPPVSSPSPAPAAVPTPRPIVPTAPPVTVAATNAPSGMNADLKAILLAAVPVVLGFVFATITAASITRKAERERMEFQKEAELQKQRMELYKILFTERVAAVKKFSELLVGIHDKVVDVCLSEDDEAHEKWLILYQSHIDAILFYNSISWQFTSEVNEKTTEFNKFVKTFVTQFVSEKVNSESERAEELIKESNTIVNDLAYCIRTMMLDDDLSHLVKKKTSY